MNMEEFLDKFHDCAENIQSAVANIECELRELDSICCETPEEFYKYQGVIKKSEHAELFQMVRGLRRSLSEFGLESCVPFLDKDDTEVEA